MTGSADTSAKWTAMSGGTARFAHRHEAHSMRVERGEDRIDLATRQSEHELDALGGERAHQELAAADLVHEDTSPSSAAASFHTALEARPSLSALSSSWPRTCSSSSPR
jgi:hypothetical protein